MMMVASSVVLTVVVLNYHHRSVQLSPFNYHHRLSHFEQSGQILEAEMIFLKSYLDYHHRTAETHVMPMWVSDFQILITNILMRTR